MNKYVALILFSLPGLVLAVLSIVVGWILFPNIIHSEIVKQIRLVEGSDTWNKWKEAPIPVYLSFYIQSVTNPDEVENGLQPVFVEKGPYVYRQKRVKVDIKQEDGENTVKYKEVRTFFFDQQKSGNNTELDVVTIPNVPFVSVINTIRKMIPLDIVAALVGNVVLNGESLLRRNVLVREVLFQGFDVSRYTQSILSAQLPKEFSGGRFGLYKGKNGTASEEWEIYTGVDNPMNFGRIKTWNGKKTLGFWRPLSDCDIPKGTDGAINPPFLTKETVLQVFGPDACRSLPIVYHEDVEFLGIPGYRFAASEESFQDPRINSANRCFCLEDNLEDCSHSGVLPLESCTKAPLWVSPPHFMGADVRYLAESGQSPPDVKKHTTFIDIEPTTGLILRARKRLQFNLEVRYNRKVRALQRLTKEKFLFPLVWADESAEIDDNIADQLKGQLFTPVKIVNIVKWIVLVVGLLLFLLGAGYSVQKYFLRNAQQSKNGGVALNRSSTPSASSNSNTSSSSSRSTNSKKRKKSAVAAAAEPKVTRPPSLSSSGSISYID